MRQVPVKWVHKERLVDEQASMDVSTLPGYVPVVPLSALREVVEFIKAVRDKHYQTWKHYAEFADDSTDHNVMHTDLMKHDPIYAGAQRLLASLGEVGK